MWEFPTATTVQEMTDLLAENFNYKIGMDPVCDKGEVS